MKSSVDRSARAARRRRGNNVAVVLAVTVERLVVDGLFHVRAIRVFRGVADVDCLWLLDAELLETFGNLTLTATTKRCRDDVVEVVSVAVQAVNVDGDFHIRVCRTASGVADGDFAVGSLPLVDLFGNRSSIAAFGWGWDDVVLVVGVTSQSVGVDGDFDVWIGCATRGVANLDSIR